MERTSKEITEVIDRVKAYLQSDSFNADSWHTLIDELIRLSSETLTTEAQEQLQDSLAELPSLAGKRTEYLDKALDKLNANWSMFVGADPDGQLCFELDTTAGNKKGVASVLFSIDFASLGDNVSITKKLLPYDQLVYMAVDALYRAGNQFVTVQQVYRMLGHDGQCGKHDKEKIDKALTKLKAAHITIDNTIEVKKAKYNYPHIVVDTQLLNAVRCRIYENGQLVDGAYKILDEPVLMSFARGRGQVTQIDRKLLNVPKLNATDETIAIQSYLIDRIAKAKNKKSKCVIVLETIYTYADIKGKQKQRAPQKIIKILDHYKQINYIKSYQFKEDNLELVV